MPDWRASMQRTYEFYEVEPITWKDVRRLDTVKSCTISWDSEAETLGSASLDVDGLIGECYVRVYMITLQNGIREKIPLGTFLMQTPSSSFNGKVNTVTVDAYTPLIELKEKMPPIGFYIPGGENILGQASALTKGNARALVVATKGNRNLNEDFVAETNGTWLKYLSSLLAMDKHHYMLDELGKIYFAPEQDIETLQPVWTYDDGNSSILYPEISVNRDLYGIPNVVEVVYSTPKGSGHAIVRNTDPNSPTSIPNRGREIWHRVTDPDLHDLVEYAPDGVSANVAGYSVEHYATELLKKLSTVEYSVSYTHGYCPVKVGDCVRLNYERAGLVGIKAKVISQSIKCSPDCPVSEKAVFSTKLWG